LLVATAAMAAACEQSFPEWKRGRTFSVTVRMGDRPLPRMRVLLEPVDDNRKSDQVEATSNENGIANFTGVRPGRYYVETSRLGVEVGPGTVVVAKQGSSEPIGAEWPLRIKYTVNTLAGRLEHHVFRKSNPIDGFVHPQTAPLSGARLTLSRIDSQEEIAAIGTNANGGFDFPTVDPGQYLLHIQEQASPEFTYLVDDFLVIDVDPKSPRSFLSLHVDWTSCGMTAAEVH